MTETGTKFYDEERNFEYEMLEDGTLKLLGFSSFVIEDEEYDIPMEFEGYRITSIDEAAFRNCSIITRISIPDSVTTIGNSAFYDCSSLATISIPDSVTTIGNSAFYGCSSLATITIPNSVTDIDIWAFFGCTSLTSINVSEGNNYFTSIDGVLYSKDAKTLIAYPGGKDGEYIIPEGTIFIKKCAFAGCHLTKISIPYSIRNVGYCAITDCSDLVSINVSEGNNYFTSIDGVLYSKDAKTLIAYPGGKGGEYSILEGTTTIEKYSFDECRSLTSIVIPDSVISIGDYAFESCLSLTSIIIPDSVTFIGEGAFYCCNGLTNITLPDSITSIEKGAFCSCNELVSVNIPDSITKIEDSMFSRCYKLDGIIIPETITIIGDAAFENCNSLSNIIIPNSVTTIGDRAFEGCKSLSNIIIPDSVTTIGERAFGFCSSLVSVEIPNSVSSFGVGVFVGCFEIESITIPKTIPKQDATRELFYLRPWKKLKEIHAESFTWEEWISLDKGLELPYDMTVYLKDGQRFGKVVEDGIIYYVSKIDYKRYVYSADKEITIARIKNEIDGEPVTYISEAAFNECSSLVSVTIPDNIEFIEMDAFRECFNLANVEIGSGVKRINMEAFFGCSSLTSIGIPGSMEYIDNSAFDFCEHLSEIHAESFTKEEWRNIYDCRSNDMTVYLKDGHRDGKVVEDGITYYFRGDERHVHRADKDLTIARVKSEIEGEPVTYIDFRAFGMCTNLTSINIPSSVRETGGGVFDGCTSLTRINIFEDEKCLNGAPWGAPETAVINVYKKGSLIYDDERNLVYEVNHNETLSVKSTIEANVDSFECNIPSEYNGISVTTILDNAFLMCSNLSCINIPDSIELIGKYAFSECSSLKSICIPDSVKIIGENAFYGCSSLDSVNIIGDEKKIEGTPWGTPESTTINYYEAGTVLFDEERNFFYKVVEDGTLCIEGQDREKELTCELVIPSEYKGFKIASIGREAFVGCSFIKSMTIPKSIKSIKSGAFGLCPQAIDFYADSFTKEEWRSILDDMTLPTKAIVYLRDGQRDGMFIEEGIGYSVNPKTGKRFVCYADKDIVVAQIKNEIEGEPVTAIDSSAFLECSRLASVTIPESVSDIRLGAFMGCTSLNKVNIPNSIKQIGIYAFRMCTSLTSINIPASVRDIGFEAFSGCTNLTRINILNGEYELEGDPWGAPKSTEIIDYDQDSPIWDLQRDLVYELTARGTLSVKGTIKRYGKFDKYDIPSEFAGFDVTSIEEGAFKKCANIKSIIVPESVVSIEDDAFSGCTNLAEIKINEGKEKIKGTPWGAPESTVITVCEKETEIYDEKRNLLYKVIGEKTLCVLSPIDFEKESWECDIPFAFNGFRVTSIIENAFKDCSNLTSIKIPASIETIGENAFEGCSKLTRIILIKDKHEIQGAPWGASESSQICVYERGCLLYDEERELVYQLDENETLCVKGTKDLGRETMPGVAVNKDLCECVIPSEFNGLKITSIDGYAFSCCLNLSSVSIPDSVTHIDKGIFFMSFKITNIKIPSSVKTIDEEAFVMCPLSNIEIDKRKDSIPGAPWGAKDAVVKWLED